MKAADVMSTNVVSVRGDTSAAQIAKILLDNRISAVPVVNEAGDLLGIVSEGDLIHRVEAGTERHRSWWLELLTAKETLEHEFIKCHARNAVDLMAHPVVTVKPDTPLDDVAFLLEKHRIKRVPVMKDGRIVGIVSRANLIQALVNQDAVATSNTGMDDAALNATLVTRLQSHPWWPDRVNVVVRERNVELWGIVESEVEKDAVRVAVEGIAGARTISNYLSINPKVPGGL